ncbi:MAG: N-acetylmuramoyl-L-alanine amidase [Clostridiales bacterium]|jgi:N-acetylmuramoyl-L-alanine amidase|nr:N-acetylmuramoyl-L-alanine amidase [Clostridiales bacterium]
MPTKPKLKIAAFVLLIACVALLLATCVNAAPTGGKSVPFDELVIVVDAGHGDTDVGAIGAFTGRYEKEINLEIALKLQAALQSRGATVIMTRSSDAPLGPADEGDIALRKENDMLAREEIIERARAHLVISVHQNSFEDPDVKNPQLFYLKNNDTGEEAGKAFCEVMQQTINSDLNIRDGRGISYGNWRLLKKGNQPGCILECGFLTNQEEELLLQDGAYQDKLVEAIVHGVENYIAKYGI